MGAGELIDVVPFGNSPSGFKPRSAAAFTLVGKQLQHLAEAALFGHQPHRLGNVRRSLMDGGG